MKSSLRFSISFKIIAFVETFVDFFVEVVDDFASVATVAATVTGEEVALLLFVIKRLFCDFEASLGRCVTRTLR